MALGYGAISMSAIKTEFGGGSPPNNLMSYYRGGTYVPDIAPNSSIATSGLISMLSFRGASKTLPVPTFVAAGSWDASYAHVPAIQAGDLLVMVAFGTSGAPTGWTQQMVNGNGRIFTKIAAGIDAGLLVTYSYGVIAAFRGVSQVAPVDVVGTMASGTTSAALTAASVTTGFANDMVLFAAIADTVGTGDRALFADPSTGTARTRALLMENSPGGTTMVGLGLWYALLASAGATGTETQVITTMVGPTSISNKAVLLALKSAVADTVQVSVTATSDSGYIKATGDPEGSYESVSTGGVTATASGGTAPYTYTWQKLTGSGLSNTGTSGASISWSFSASGWTYGDDLLGIETWRCQVTDSASHTGYSVPISVTCEIDCT